MLLEQVQGFFGIGEQVAAPTPIVVPTSTMVPIPVAVLSPAPAPRVPSRGPRKGKEVKPPTRRLSGLQKFRDRFKLLLAKFSRASREPVTLSSGLVPERKEDTDITEIRYVELFD